ncbi:unnamed protein product [Orchesella dallaii]|uniref:Uncharacterized protein n=1 Tax=Orchesella dallaii TaxID=48710 RepID=A0ABP1R5T1_9HEXA
MSSKAGGSNRLKTLEEENTMLKQLTTTWTSSRLFHKTRYEIRIILERIASGLAEFSGYQKQWEGSYEKFETSFEPGQDNESFALFEQWKLVRDKYELVKTEKETFYERFQTTLGDFNKKSDKWTDPGAEQFEFAQRMTMKQRKKLVKECEPNEKFSLEASTAFEAFGKEWDGIEADVEDCLKQAKKICDAYCATKNK